MENSLDLEANHEWRFEVGFKEKVLVKLVNGHAEVFGTELALGQEYEFSGQSGAVYSWQGCKLEYSGKVSEYTSEDTPMPVYANLHFALEGIRQSTTSDSPCRANIMCVGPNQSGKSSLVKILTAYALKQGRTPIVVNLDPKTPQFLPPGGISATLVDDVLDVENGWGYSAVNGPTPVPPKQPLTYNFGLDSASKNQEYYESILASLGSQIRERTTKDEKIHASGLIVDTPGDFYSGRSNFNLVTKAISALDIGVLAVVGDERMFSEISRKFKQDLPALQVVKLPKSGGVVVDSESSALRQTQHRAIQQYYYGISHQTLSSFTLTVRSSEIKVYRVIEAEGPTDMSLTSGDAGDYIADEVQTTPEYLTTVEVSSILQNCLLAMVNAAPTDPIEVIQKAEVLGYVHIVEADDNKKNIKVLLPMPGRLPNKALIMGDFRYHE